MYIKSNYISSDSFVKYFDKLSNVNFSFFYDYIPTKDELNINEINIFCHSEPDEYFGHHKWIENNFNSFSLVLTWNERIIKKCSNSVLLLYGEPWIDQYNEESIYENVKKEFEICFIRGNKLMSGGHLLRHQIFDRQDEIVIPKRFYSHTDVSSAKKLIDGKVNAHQKSMYSLIVENTSHHNYFTEKISDAIIMKSIPIYWGCSNIEKYYDIDGIIQIKSDDDAIEKINSLTPEFYESKKEVIEKNYRRSFEYRNYNQRIANTLDSIFKLNKFI